MYGVCVCEYEHVCAHVSLDACKGSDIEASILFETAFMSFNALWNLLFLFPNSAAEHLDSVQHYHSLH